MNDKVPLPSTGRISAMQIVRVHLATFTKVTRLATCLLKFQGALRNLRRAAAGEDKC